MIKIEKTDVVGWEHAIRGMRNPKNSWDRSDSFCIDDCMECSDRLRCEREMSSTGGAAYRGHNYIGPNDHELMMKLSAGGPVHAKYRRMIVVYADITAPLYWWKEFDTYKVGTVANSCSTMHKIQDKEFTFDDFSWEHLFSVRECKTGEMVPTLVLDSIIKTLNFYRKKWLEIDEEIKSNPKMPAGQKVHLLHRQKRCWWQMIQLLPSSYNQKRTVMMNYEVLHNIYYSPRWNHKVDDWVEFCEWIKKLPYHEIILNKGD